MDTVTYRRLSVLISDFSDAPHKNVSSSSSVSTV